MTRIGKNDKNGEPIEVGHILRGDNRWTIVITGVDSYEITKVGDRPIDPDHKQPGSMATLRTELYFTVVGHVDEKQPHETDVPVTIADQRHPVDGDRKDTFDAR